MADFSDLKKQTEELQQTAVKSIGSLFPIVGKTKKLRLKKIWVDDKTDSSDIRSQFKAKVSERTWGAPIYGEFELVDKKTGEITTPIKKVRLTTLPRVTPRLSYIIKGKEVVTANQLRLRSAGYIVRQMAGGVKSQINLAKGYSGQIELHAKPETGVISVKIGQANQKLYPILNALGVSDSLLEKAWGEDALAANKKLRKGEHDSSIRSFAKSISKKTFNDTDLAVKEIRKFIDRTAMDGKINKRTIGKPHEKMDGSFLTDISGKLLQVLRGKEDPHDRNALAFKEYRQLKDLIEERLSMQEFRKKIVGKITNNINAGREKVEDVVNATVVNPHIEAVFQLPELKQLPKQLNPLDMINNATLVTIMGPGGIRDKHQITDDMRNVHPSHLGFLDPIHTPETDMVGVVYHTPVGVSDKNKTLLTRAINVRTGKLERIPPDTFADSNVAFPEEWDKKKKAFVRPDGVLVLDKNNQTVKVKEQEVDYVLQSPKQVFSIASNLTPFLSTNSGGRALIASKLAEQAVPLKDREAPYVQSKIGGKVTFEDLLGDAFSFKAPVDGIVTTVKKDAIVIKDGRGEKHEVSLYDNFPLNQKSFVDSEKHVKKGDIVKRGQLIADTIFTKDGQLANGKNLTTAYLPYKGYNFEDGIVITEGGAKKLTSVHMHTKDAKAGEKQILNRDKFVAHYPAAYTKDQVSLLDEDGVVKKGTVLQPGDPIIATLRKEDIDPDNLIFGKLSRTLIKPWRDDSTKWDGDAPGKVVNVMRQGSKVKVFIKTEEPAKIGDKLVGRFGNKGIITKIVPDKEAPKTKDGEDIDIFYNPHGVITRINVGQLLESAVGKVAKKNGERYVVDNFADKNYTKEVQDHLAKNGVLETEEVIDPTTGKSLGQVNVGQTYVLKLEKQVRSQYSARGGGPGWKYSQHTQEPIKGGEEGSKAMDLLTFYSMLGHGARHNLREMATYKASRNDEFWNSIKTGSLIPTPKPTFAYNKFIAYLKGAGVNVQQNGSKLTLAPMTDREVENISNGAIKDFQFIRAKDLAEVTNGLMDKQITGGVRGDKWSHIDLAEPIVNPIFEQPVKTILDLDNKTYKGLIAGTIYIDEEGNFNEEGQGLTAGAAIQSMLKNVDKKTTMARFKRMASKSKNPSQINKANKGVRYIEALNKFDLEADAAYIQTKVPVLPPTFRPIYALPDGNLHTSPVNFLYRDLGLANQKLTQFNKIPYMPEAEKAALRKDLYDGAAAIAGLGNPIGYYPSNRPVKGIIDEIKGSKAVGSKSGFFQRHVLRREQDLVGRGTIIPEPKLGVDEVGLPEDMAWTIFQPFIIRQLVRQGYRPIDADKELEERGFVARKALESVMADRPVLLNRAPTLHKFGIMAFKPKLVEGRAIKIPPLVVKGFNADFNGDSICMSAYTLVEYGKKLISIKLLDLAEAVTGLTIQEMIIDAKGGTAVYELKPNELQTISLVDGKPSWEAIHQITIHTSHEACYNIQTHTGTKTTVTEHHNFSYVNDEFDLITVKTDKLKTGLLIPKAFNFHKEAAVQQITIGENLIDVTPDFAWLLGFYAGDGSAGGGAVTFCETKHDIFEKVQHLIESIFEERTTPQNTSTHARSIYRLYKRKYIDWFAQNCGARYDTKFVPGFIFYSPKDVKLAYIDGVFQAEGNISPDKFGNYLVRIEMSNHEYIKQLRTLMASIGIGTYIRKQKKGSTVIRVAKQYYDKIQISDGQKYAELQKAASVKSKRIKKDFFDVVPMSDLLYEDCISIGKKHKALTKLEKEDRKDWQKNHVGRRINIRDHYKRSKKYISRYIANDIIYTYGAFATNRMKKWIETVQNTSLQWEIISSCDLTTRHKVMGDFSVPNGETFAIENGLLTHNTMQLHVPILHDAVEEAKGMMPSKHIFNPGKLDDIMMAPSQDAAIGLYFLTKDGKKTTNKVDSSAALAKKLEAGEISINDMVRVAGKDTSPGRAMVDAVLPEKFRGRNTVLNEGGIKKILVDIAKEDPKSYAVTVNKLTELGNNHAFQRGVTITLGDLQPDLPLKDKLLAEAEQLSKKLSDKDKIKLYTKVDKEIKKIIDKELGAAGNNLWYMVHSGARGNIDQLKQIVSAPLLVEDATGKTHPIPVTESFSKGLSTGSYWNSMYGARRGVIDKQLQTAKPGEFNKDLMATVVKNVITSKDCESDQGLEFSITDNDVFDRYLVKDTKIKGRLVAKKGDLVTPNVAMKLKTVGVKTVTARSPLTCHKGKGTCAKCYGLDSSGTLPMIGDNIGAIAGQSLTEPLTQMVLRSMHSGGVAGTGMKITGYDKIDKIVRLPRTIVGKATLASQDGVITGVEEAPAGGKNVFIDDKKHYVSANNPLKVKRGTKVKAGDAISGGLIHPRELVALKGMLPTQQYIAKEILDAYRDTGVNLKAKNVEAVVRSTTDTTTVVDGGDSNFVLGDIVPYAAAEAFNRKSAGKLPLNDAIGKTLFKKTGPFRKGTSINASVAKALEGLDTTEVQIGPMPIVHEPFVDGIKQLPMLSKDWMAQMGYGHIAKGIKFGASEGWETDIHGYSPVPAFAYGAEFGQGEEGKY